MGETVSILDVLDKSQTGPYCSARDWEAKILPSKIREKLREHGLENTCDRENPINADDGLADDYWRAGYELALDLGLYCPTTERIIKFSDSELKYALMATPSEITLGWGPDRRTIKARRPEDPTLPLAALSCLGMEVSEELFVPLFQSIAQYRIIDILLAGLLRTVYGRPPKSKTPYETFMGKYEAVLMKEVLRRVGRPGMPTCGVEGSPTDYAQLGGYGVPDGYDPNHSIAIVLMPSPLKLDYILLNKIVHALNCNSVAVEIGTWSMIGGYSGPPEGAAVEAVAGLILECAAFGVINHSTVMDIRYLGNCGKEALWATSVSRQAQTRNTHALTFGITSQVSGPCTDMLLYETATISIADSVSGSVMEMGTRPTGCKYPDYGSGLENKFCAEVVKSAASLRRSDANEIVKVLLPKYEDKLRYPLKGKSFTECTDIRTLQPTKEWQEIYDRVWKELEDLGLKKKY
jgi:methylamine--corrinoid protein Co-methyltransferase